MEGHLMLVASFSQKLIEKKQKTQCFCEDFITMIKYCFFLVTKFCWL